MKSTKVNIDRPFALAEMLADNSHKTTVASANGTASETDLNYDLANEDDYKRMIYDVIGPDASEYFDD